MRIVVKGGNSPVSGALAAHIAKRLDYAVRPFFDHVDRVAIRLVDLDGPNLGRDKRCRIVATLHAPLRGVVVDATDADAYVAVSQAAARLGERIARVVSREQAAEEVTPRGLGQ